MSWQEVSSSRKGLTAIGATGAHRGAEAVTARPARPVAQGLQDVPARTRRWRRRGGAWRSLFQGSNGRPWSFARPATKPAQDGESKRDVGRKEHDTRAAAGTRPNPNTDQRAEARPPQTD